MSHFIHGDNIDGKLAKNNPPENTRLLNEIKHIYDVWKKANMQITGTTKANIKNKTQLLNKYKEFINQTKFKKEGGNSHGFSSQSKLHSTVIEEFMYYLFKDIEALSGKGIDLGPTSAYSNLFFAPPNIGDFAIRPTIVLNLKEQDFSISKKINLQASVSGESKVYKRSFAVPIVSIECKTYIDKTMYEGSVATAEKIKKGNPYCLFLIVVECYDVSFSVEPRYSQINQIYVLRKQKRKDRNSAPIYSDTVWKLFQKVKIHLENDWAGVEDRLKTGMMI